MLSHHPVKENRRAWWNHLNFPTKRKRVIPYRPHDLTDHPVFGKSLNESLTYVSVQISTADANGNLYVWGYIPVVVAKCGLYLKENATEVPGTFRVNGSNRRMRELQAAFETPPRYGKNLDWRKEHYTTHDVASVFRRYLTQMPEPVIPYDMYHLFRDALAKLPFNEEEVITTYKSLIRKLPKPNQYLLLYVLDLLSVFARKCDKNLMTATNLAVIFRPGLISHPQHDMSPQEYELSQRVLEFLIAQQDWFMLDISPPTPGEPGDLQNNGGSRNAGRHERFGSNNGHRNGGTLGESGVEVPSSPGWNENPEAGPSTPRQRLGSIPAWSPSTQPSPPSQQINTQGSGSHTLGQLTEQITPVSSVPPSPTTPHFERSKASPVLPSIIPEGITPVQGVQHQRRPSNLVHQVNRPRSRSPPTRTGTPGSSLPSDVEELMVIPSAASIRSAEEEDPAASLVPGGGGWKIVGRNVRGSTVESVQRWRNLPHGSGGAHAAGFMAIGAPRRDKEREKEEEERIKTMRRRTTMERSGFVPHGKITIIEENPSTPELTSGSGGGGRTSIQRSRTLPSRRKDTLRSAEDLAGAASTDKENEKEGFGGLWGYRKDKDKEKPEKRVLKKQRRTSGQVHSVASTSASAAAGGTSNTGANPFSTPAQGMQSSNRTLGTSSLGTQTGRENQPSGGSLSKS